MFLKKRDVPLQLQYLRALKPRMELPWKYENKWRNNESGIVGEIVLDDSFVAIDFPGFVIPDLRFEMGGNFVQMDSVVVGQGEVHIFEAKNYAGKYYFKGEQFFHDSGRELKNPLRQAENNALMMRQVLSHWDCNFEVKHWLVFTNPDFEMLHADWNQPILLSHQIQGHLEQLSRKISLTTEADKKIALGLAKLHNPTSEMRFLDNPPYAIESLAKGLVCEACCSLSMDVVHRTCICRQCGCKTSAYDQILRAAEDFQLLFPKKALCITNLREFCGEKISRRIIRTALEQKYELVRLSSRSYYK